MSEKSNLILIVDDNPNNIQFLGSLLIPEGYEIGVAGNGVEAFTFCEEKTPDLILLDVMMPEMDGYKFCTRLKDDMALSHIPVIFLTAKNETPDIVRGFEAGGSDYVSKPFIAAELMARIKTHLEINQLRHLIPICLHCKKVRDDKGFWDQLDHYISVNTKTMFSHGICKDCAEKYYPEFNLYKDEE